jgi:hypothetical protein
MSQESFTPLHRKLGRTAAFMVFGICVVYAVTTTLGFFSLKSPLEPIGDPYFTIMEILIILLSPLMVFVMISVHAFASQEVKAYGFTALIFMIIMAGITSSLHFTILTVSRQIEAAGFSLAPLLFSFKWPSAAYTLDILAWDWFFALSLLFAVPVFKDVGIERAIRYLLIVSGVLSLVGLLGVPLAIMKVEYWANVRNIGIIGYAFVSPVAFLLLGIVFGRAKSMPEETTRRHSLQAKD